MIHPEALDPRTIVDIKETGCPYCEQRPKRWSICDFHEGYDAALGQHDPDKETDE